VFGCLVRNKILATVSVTVAIAGLAFVCLKGHHIRGDGNVFREDFDKIKIGMDMRMLYSLLGSEAQSTVTSIHGHVKPTRALRVKIWGHGPNGNVIRVWYDDKHGVLEKQWRPLGDPGDTPANNGDITEFVDDFGCLHRLTHRNGEHDEVIPPDQAITPP
jgi:hypothetical protein